MEWTIPQAALDADLTEAQNRHTAAVELCREQRYAAAEPLAREAWALLRGHPDASPGAVAAFGHNLGIVLDRLGRLAEAEVIHRHAVAAAELVRANDQLTRPLVEVLSALAVNLFTQERFDEAEAHLQRGMALAEISADVTEVESVALLWELGTLYRLAGRLAESEAVYRRVRFQIEDQSGFGHSAAADLYRQLALLEQTRGRHEVGEGYARRALEIRMAASGPNYPDVVGDGAVLGSLLVAQGRYEEAEPLLRHALETFDATAGGDSPAVAWVADRLGSLLAAAGRADEAIEVYRRALRIKEAVFGEVHPALTTTMHNLAVVCEGNGRTEEARELWARAMTLLSHDDAVAEA